MVIVLSFFFFLSTSENSDFEDALFGQKKTKCTVNKVRLFFYHLYRYHNNIVIMNPLATIIV